MCLLDCTSKERSSSHHLHLELRQVCRYMFAKRSSEVFITKIMPYLYLINLIKFNWNCFKYRQTCIVYMCILYNNVLIWKGKINSILFNHLCYKKANVHKVCACYIW